jgi:TonB-dependent starch-binding outer membrane protein SusC
MKLMLVLIFTVGILTSFGEGYSQTTKLSLDLKNSSIESVLTYIENHTEYSFMYDNKKIDVTPTVDITAKDQTVADILVQIFDNVVDFQVIGKHIILTPKVSESSSVAQQKKTVSGKVTDSSGGQLQGVTVVVKGTSQGTITDANGNYTLLNVASDASLLFSFVGMKTQDVPVAGKSTINMVLTEETLGIDEVVVIGYGTMKKSDLTGAVVSVSSETIKKSMSTSLEQALQGNTAGVVVTQNSGQPGGGVSVRIRGINSITQGNEPLYVIDGVPISADFGADLGGNPLASINTSDIESMEVLKDASSAAIYGSRAANGVILITTRKGVRGKTKLTLDMSTGWQKIEKKLDMMNLREYAIFDNARSKVMGIDGQPGLSNPSALGAGTDWQSSIFRTAPMTKYQFGLSSGDEKTIYSLSLGYLDQDGIMIGSGFKRYSGHLNFENQSTKWLKTGANVMFNITKENINSTYFNPTLLTQGSLLITALNMTPDVPIKNPDGTWGGYTEEQMLRAGSTAFIDPNPVGLMKILKNDIIRNTLVGKVYADITIIKGLTFRNEFGGTTSNSTYDQFVPTYTFGVKENPNNLAYHQKSNSFNWNMNSYLTYNKDFGEGTNMTLLAAHEAYLSQYENLSASTPNLQTNYINNVLLGDITKVSLGDYTGNESLESYFGRLLFTLKDKYILTATLRTDGSSKFGPKNRWGNFPSAALAWKVSNEPFLKNISTIDNLKLRLSYGLVGNSSIPAGAFIPGLLATTTHWGIGYRNDNMPNTEVKWESTKSTDIGIDLNMFKNRIEFIFDAYIKNTDNLLLPLPLPLYSGTTGFIATGSPYVNIGKLQNKGFDFTISTVNVSSEFSWKTSFNFSLNRNKVTKLNSQNGVIDNSLGSGFTRTAVGQPIGLFYGYVNQGILKTGTDVLNAALPAGVPISEGTGAWVGDLKFKDINKDGVIDGNDRTYIGDPNPKFSAGITNSFSYKGFELSVFITGVFGNKIYNDLKNNIGGPRKYNTGLKSIANFAQPTLIDPSGPATIENATLANPGTNMFRAKSDYEDFNFETSDFWVEDGSYIRVKNILLAYDLPRNTLDKLHLANFRIYGSIQNALTFTKYTGYDPEIGSLNGNMLISGIDSGRYPSSRTFTLGISVNF